MLLPPKSYGTFGELCAFATHMGSDHNKNGDPQPLQHQECSCFTNASCRALHAPPVKLGELCAFLACMRSDRTRKHCTMMVRHVMLDRPTIE